MEKMIDIHSHLIPQFDDGPRSFDESLQMLRIASEQGITDVFATSHFNDFIPDEVEVEYFEKLQMLREEAISRNININIYSGSELFFHHYVEKTLKTSKVATLGGLQQYVLIEFPMFQMPAGLEEVLFEISINNLIPIVAHPERYSGVLEKPSRALKFIRHGGLLQVNAGSIMGHFGKETQKLGMNLLDQQVVHFIASDAHAPDGRTFILRKTYEYLRSYLPEDYLEELFYKNPRNIIDEVKIEKINLPPEKKSGGFFNKLINRFKPSSSSLET
jgi:protein-tyrosine phosphatase